jgi:hypothetical protein
LGVFNSRYAEQTQELPYVVLLVFCQPVLLGGFCVAALSEVLQVSAGQRYPFEPRSLEAMVGSD